VTTNECGEKAADEALAEAKTNFYKIAGFEYNKLPRLNLLRDADAWKKSAGYLVA
jgi:hypothetical protein